MWLASPDHTNRASNILGTCQSLLTLHVGSLPYCMAAQPSYQGWWLWKFSVGGQKTMSIWWFIESLVLKSNILLTQYETIIWDWDRCIRLCCTHSLLVVEPDYLPYLEVLSFSRVYNPWSTYTREVCKLFHAGGFRGKRAPSGGLGASRPPTRVRGQSPRRKNFLVKVYCNFIVNLNRSL